MDGSWTATALEAAQDGSKPVISEQLVHIDMRDERVQDVLTRVTAAIKTSYTNAEFVSYVGTNPLGIYIEVYTPGDDFDGILHLLSEKFDNLHIAAGVNICVVPRKKAHAQAA